MRVSRSLKVIGVVVLGVCSSQIAPVLLERSRARAAAGAAAAPPDGEEVRFDKPKRANDAGDAPAVFDPKDVGQLDANCLCASSLDKFSVVAEGHLVRVSASTTILEKRQNTAYVWSITVTDRATQNVVSDLLYRTQLFSLQPPASAFPTFNEAFELNPGAYLVELRLFSIPKGFDLDKLMDKQVAESQVLLSGGEEISVEN